MPRQARIVLPGIPHHITQRGNYAQKVFDEEIDYPLYGRWMSEYAAEYKFDILAYCLMGNHVHFIGIPHTEEVLAKIFNTVHMRYSHYMHRKRKQKGHLWQGRFYSCILDESHLYRAVRYVERNPVRAQMVKEAWEYRWSSAGYHVGHHAQEMIPLSNKFDLVKKDQWKEYLKEEDAAMCEEMRLKTRRGLVVGTDGFVKQVEEKLKRSLKCLNQGRPKKVVKI